MEPTAAEIQSFQNVQNIMDWAGVDDTLRDAYFEKVGTIRLIRELAGLTEKDATDAIDSMLLPVSGETTTRSPLPVEKTRLGLARVAARLRCGLSATEPKPGAMQLGPGPLVGPPVAAVPDAGSGIELGTVWDQSSRTQVVMLKPREITRLYETYQTRRGALPHADADVTDAQLSAMKQVLDAGRPPAADFAIFGPHGNRLVRKLHFTAQFVDGEGRLTKRELPGPPDYAAWYNCYKCYRTSLIMLNVSEPEFIDNYADHIKELDALYQGRLWFLICMADFRMRTEHFERMRRRLELEHDKLTLASPSVAAALVQFDPSRPWNDVFRLAPDESGFWDREVKDQSSQFLLALAPARVPLRDGTAQPTLGAHQSPRGERPGTKVPPPPGATDGVSARKRKRMSSGQRNAAQNICADFNTAAGCTKGDNCSSNHICSHCNMKSHGEHDCRIKLRGNKKGKGKGKGKGKW